jgi:hypothetical protein
VEDGRAAGFDAVFTQALDAIAEAGRQPTRGPAPADPASRAGLKGFEMATNTTNKALPKPALNADIDAWGGFLNAALDRIDGWFTWAAG